MNDCTISNELKQANYTEQFRRLKIALKNGFNLEAMFIEYAILEDRTESILRHADLWEAYVKRRGIHGVTINSKIQYIQKRATSGNKLLAKYFSDDLLDRVLAWKEERNRLIHALLKQQLTEEDVNRIASEGNDLVRVLRSRASAYNKSLENLK